MTQAAAAPPPGAAPPGASDSGLNPAPGSTSVPASDAQPLKLAKGSGLNRPPPPRDDTHAYRWKPFGGSPHAWALDIMRRLDPGQPVRLLDVGAASGYVGLAIRQARTGPTQLVGVEIEPHAREALAQRYDTVHESLEALGPDERFDAALLLDVIEHTPVPRATLEWVARRVRPGGTVLVSVPNVAHWSSRLLLLFGFWNYGRSGILDETHLWFFTRGSFLDMLKEAGLEVESFAPAVAPVELLAPSIDKWLVWRLLRRIRLGLARLLPGLLAYQLLARCRTPR